MELSTLPITTGICLALYIESFLLDASLVNFLDVIDFTLDFQSVNVQDGTSQEIYFVSATLVL
jgi:hypothetical protein